PLGREVQNAEVRRSGRIDVLLADVASRASDSPLKIPGCGLDTVRITLVGGVHQALVVLDWELGIDRKPDRFSLLAIWSGELDGKLYALATALLGCHIAGVLLRG